LAIAEQDLQAAAGPSCSLSNCTVI